MSRVSALLFLLLLHPAVALRCLAQKAGVPAPTTQLQGLRSQGHTGSFADGATLPDGSLVLLFNAADGIHLLKTGPDATTILAQAQQGAAGDTGIALTTDGAGSLYVAGTSTSGHLQGTGGVVFPSPADTTTNAFIARFDANLNLVFLSFLGAGKTEVNALAATADAVFVTGITYGSTFPTTPSALQSSAPNQAEGNAFVQRFSTDGSTLRYATFLDAPGGSTPEAITADSTDRAYIAGATSSPDFPTRNALQPAIAGSSSGYLTQLAVDGGSVVFSTFIAGSGISSLALDPTSGDLLLSGNVAPGQFPIAHASAPLANLPYQSVLRLSADGQTFLDSVLLLPGTQTYLQPAPDGTLWVTGALQTPLPPATNDGPGDAYVLHLTSTGIIDQLLRLGGAVSSNPGYATLATQLATPVLSSDGRTVYLPGTVAAHTAPSLRAGQTFDLAVNAGSSSLLPNSATDLLPATCAENDVCSGSGGLLSVLTPASPQAFLAVSAGDAPNYLIRNTGPVTASALTVAATGFNVSTDCPPALQPFAQCTAALAGSGPGTLSVTAANAPPAAITIPASSTTSAPSLALDSSALDFGIVTASSPVTRTLTATNLGQSPQTFASSPVALPTGSTYTLTETGGTCAGPPSAHLLPAGASCTLQLTLYASSSAQGDGAVRANWGIGPRTLPVSGYTQAAAVSLSATVLDFGPQPTSSSGRLPLFSYLSNSSNAAVAHSSLTLPQGSPFSVQDNCPALLPPASVCSLAFTYAPSNVVAFDSLTVNLDTGLSVLLTGEALPQPATSTSLAPSPLVVNPSQVAFPTAVPVSSTSSAPQFVQVTNSSSSAVPISTSALGDFAASSDCGASLQPKATCTVTLTFTPSQPDLRRGLLLVSSAAGVRPVQVPLSGTAIPILSTANGTLDLGQTVVNEPTLLWLQLQGTFPNVTASVTGSGFTIALLADDGSGHGTLPDTAFSKTASAQCTSCWLAVRLLPSAAGTATGSLQLATSTGGAPFQVALRGQGIAAQGLVLTPPTQDFGVVALGSTSAPDTFALTNLLASAAVANIQNVTATGDFTVVNGPSSTPPCQGALAANSACGVLVAFSPTTGGRRTGSLQITTDMGTVTATLTGTGVASTSSLASAPSPSQPTITVFPAGADFGASAVGSVAGIRQFTLFNNTATSQAISFAASANFPLASPPVCPSLAPGASCTFNVAFLPQAAGPLTGSVIVSATPDSASATSAVPSQTVVYLRGFGSSSGTLAFSDATQPDTPLSFGTLASGTFLTRSMTLSNTGTVPITLRHLSSTAPFRAGTSCTSALAPGAMCELDVTYTATNQLAGTATQTPRADVGTLLVETDASGSPSTLYLSGIAAAGSGGGSSHLPALPTYTLSQGALTFPNIQPGSQAPSQTINVTNNGSTPVTFLRVQASQQFTASSTCTLLEPSATCVLTAAFAPSANASTPSAGTLTLVTDAANAVDTVSLLGSSYPTTLQFALTSLDFGPVPVGSFAQLTDTLTNTSVLPLTLGALIATGDFTVDAGTCPGASVSLPAGVSCTVTVTFTPTAAGARAGTLTLQNSASGSPQLVSLQGAGQVGRLEVSPASLDFGSVPVSTSQFQSLSLTNTGDAAVKSLSFALTGAAASDFSFTSNCGSGSLAPGASCTLSLSFTPSIAGARTAALTVSSSNPAGPLTVPLTGVGAEPPGFLLTVNGASSGTASVSSGGSANFALTLTPSGGYSGMVGLTCKALAPAPNAICSLAETQLNPTQGPARSTATLVTLSGISSSLLAPLGLFSAGSLAARRRRSRRVLFLGAMCALLGAACTVTGCGGGPGSTGHPYTPAGTYQYQVTASSMAGAALSSTVTLSLTVH